MAYGTGLALRLPFAVQRLGLGSGSLLQIVFVGVGMDVCTNVYDTMIFLILGCCTDGFQALAAAICHCHGCFLCTG